MLRMQWLWSQCAAHANVVGVLRGRRVPRRGVSLFIYHAARHHRRPSHRRGHTRVLNDHRVLPAVLNRANAYGEAWGGVQFWRRRSWSQRK